MNFRHSWGSPDRSDPSLTLRVCKNCGLRKLSHHQFGRHWITFASRDGLAFHGEGTPKCFGSENKDLVHARGGPAALSPVT